MTFLQQYDAARIAFDLSAGAFVLGEVSQALHVRRGAVRAGLGSELLFRALFFGAILCLAGGPALAAHAGIGGGAGVFCLGVLVGWLGLLLRWWSFVALGRYFTVVVMTTADQPVIERGPYRVLRHPSYSGLLLAALGFGLMLGNWLGLVASLVLLLVALVHRIGVEERALTSSLGDAYLDFAAGRSRLVPFLW